ncbi:hypothetical protein QWA68_013264 [Fusarium oxysporum]|nr:hypothetical protein QWA68_013264 [Fusarium oxysporum]
MPKASSFCVKVTDCGKLNTRGSHGLTALEADGFGISSLSDSDDTDLHMLSESRQVAGLVCIVTLGTGLSAGSFIK